jgi:hypothetical protein
MKIFNICLNYKKDSKAAKDILYLADDELRKEAQKYEKEINESIGEKAKEDIKVTKENYTKFTIKKEMFTPIYSLVYWLQADYSTKYNSVDSELKKRLEEPLKRLYLNDGNNIDEDMNKIFEICLDYPDDPLAIDILLMAEEKEGQHTQENVDDLKLSELDEKFSEIAQYVISRENVESSDICLRFGLKYDRCKIIMEQLKKVGIV